MIILAVVVLEEDRRGTPTLWANGRFANGYRRGDDQAKGEGNGCTEVQPFFFSIKTGAVQGILW